MLFFFTTMLVLRKSSSKRDVCPNWWVTYSHVKAIEENSSAKSIHTYHVIVRDCYAKETSPLAMNMNISPFKLRFWYGACLVYSDIPLTLIIASTFLSASFKRGDAFHTIESPRRWIFPTYFFFFIKTTINYRNLENIKTHLFQTLLR